MASKLINLSELESILSDEEKTNNGVVHFIATFSTVKFLRLFNSIKTKGIEVSLLLTCLIIFRLRGQSISHNTNNRLTYLPKIDDNTFYRLLNNSFMNWRKLLISFAKQYIKQTQQKGTVVNDLPKCWVIDDTVIEKSGKTLEFISRVYNHVNKTYILGFKMLLLAFWDGKTLITVDFSLHREKGKKCNYGLSAKERKNLFHKKRDSKSLSYNRINELNENKNHTALSMIKRAVKNGFIASYVLMDSWFVNDEMIKGIRNIKKGAMHVLGMCKNDKRKYGTENTLQTAKQIIVKHERKKSKYSKKYKSSYIPMVVDYKGEQVKLFLIKYRNSKSWTILLTTDKKLSFVQTIELYQIRWSIEVLFKECKQYLRLGCSQNVDFDGQIADTTLALITHTVLSLQKRFSDYETMGELFRDSQKYLLELTLWERLVKILLNFVMQIIELFEIDLESFMEKLMQNNNTSKKILAIMSALPEILDNSEKINKKDISNASAA